NGNNLSIVFGPNILSKQSSSVIGVDPDSATLYYICTHMIENYPVLFDVCLACSPYCLLKHLQIFLQPIERERVEDAEKCKKMVREKALRTQADEEKMQRINLWRPDNKQVN